MSGSTSSKKVARAARTGGGRRRDINANLGFYGLLLALAVIGTALVVFSRNERLTEVNGGSPPRAQAAADGGDQWFASYGFYLCDKFAEPIDSANNNLGFSTMNDGIIYIHPFEREYSGSNANFGAFAEEVGLKIDRDSFQLPGNPQEYVSDETKCGDATGEMVVKVWSDPSKADDGEIRRGDPNRIVLKNGQAITVAFVPKGKTDIPLPPSVPALEQAPGKYAASLQPSGAPGGLPPGVAPTPGGAGVPVPETPGAVPGLIP